MASLPRLRFDQTRAFINAGVDLAGPYSMKETKRRNSRTSKCWVVLFICMVTCAVYIDLVSELSSTCFLAALDRFISRRGTPSTLYSDLGTNFVGAARELRELQEALAQNNDVIGEQCVTRGIRWQFNPPASPNFGGSWEAAIKSMKHHIRRTIGQRPLVQEEFLTLLAKVEGILNSRPLCPLSSSPSDGFDVLTPGHFLVGAPMILSRVEPNYQDHKVNYNLRWELLSRSIQDLWKRWSNDYLHTLMQRSKWNDEHAKIRVDQLVLIIDKSSPVNHWTIGRITELLPGPDKIVRVVKLKTSTTTLTRPVNKLALLPC